MKVVDNMNNENNKIVCDGKSIMNIFMFIFCFSMSIILTNTLIKYEIRTLNSTLGLINLILTIVFILCIFSCLSQNEIHFSSFKCITHNSY